jgi:hypothetical protein
MLVITSLTPTEVDAQTCGRGDFVTPEIVHLEKINLDVKLKFDHAEIRPELFKVSFIDSTTGNLQPDVSFTFAIRDSENRIIHNASTSMHDSIDVIVAANGTAIIPVSLDDSGYGTVDITVLSIGSNPTIPVEPTTASYPCIPIPEFPIGIVAILAGAIGILIAITRYKRLLG